jgi:3D-(3,5/4)-trihydroxycyclohexane-1,2-dione acylhydrolase (decyclizing)
LPVVLVFSATATFGMGQALQQIPALRYYEARNEQGMVHAATAFAKTANRLINARLHHLDQNQAPPTW